MAHIVCMGFIPEKKQKGQELQGVGWGVEDMEFPWVLR